VLAQAARHHHRRADVIALVAQRLSHVQSHPDRQPLARDRATRGLLDRHRAAHGVGRGREDRHQSVPEPLTTPAVGRHRLAHQPVMCLENLPRPFVAGAVQQLGRTHQIGEQDRGRHREPAMS
jgi:hypothetical protein